MRKSKSSRNALYKRLPGENESDGGQQDAYLMSSGGGEWKSEV